MVKDVNLFTVRPDGDGNKMIVSEHSGRGETTSAPPLPPTPFILGFSSSLAARLSHADVISVPTSEAYGNVTRKRWTRWLLAHSSAPGGVEWGGVPPRLLFGLTVGSKQVVVSFTMNGLH